jgi:putative endonuclease
MTSPLSTSWPGLSRPSTPCFTFEHREGVVKGFSKAYGLKRLVYYEQYDDIRVAIQREKTMKHWPRAWKVRLVNGLNRGWEDLYPALAVP